MGKTLAYKVLENHLVDGVLQHLAQDEPGLGPGIGARLGGDVGRDRADRAHRRRLRGLGGQGLP